MGERGYFEIGIYHTKSALNVGTLWRSAYQLGAAGIFTIGKRYRQQGSDTLKTWRHVPLREFPSLDTWYDALPYNALVVGVEMGGKALQDFIHPARAVYLLGAEDRGLSPQALARCHQVVSLDALRTASYNVAVAGSLVMYHRFVQHNVRLGE